MQYFAQITNYLATQKINKPSKDIFKNQRHFNKCGHVQLNYYLMKPKHFKMDVFFFEVFIFSLILSLFHLFPFFFFADRTKNLIFYSGILVTLAGMDSFWRHHRIRFSRSHSFHRRQGREKRSLCVGGG